MAEIKENFDLGPLTAFKIGGPAKYFVRITKEEELKEIFTKVKESKLPFVALGGLSNVLLDSNGFAGWVIQVALEKMDKDLKNGIFKVQSGVRLVNLIQAAAQAGCLGLESLMGIPGTVGGAIRGNAGAFGKEIGSAVKQVEVFDPQTLEKKVFKKADCAFGYRHSIFKDQPELVIINVDFVLEKGDRAQLKEAMINVLEQRKKRPYSKFPSAGSVFKNVCLTKLEESRRTELVTEFEASSGQKLEGRTMLPAGWFIEQVGLKGRQIGQAKISNKHANVIINLGGAVSGDVVKLINEAKENVQKQFGVELEEEIKII